MPNMPSEDVIAEIAARVEAGLAVRINRLVALEAARRSGEREAKERARQAAADEARKRRDEAERARQGRERERQEDERRKLEAAEREAEGFRLRALWRLRKWVKASTQRGNANRLALLDPAQAYEPCSIAGRDAGYCGRPGVPGDFEAFLLCPPGYDECLKWLEASKAGGDPPPLFDLESGALYISADTLLTWIFRAGEKGEIPIEHIREALASVVPGSRESGSIVEPVPEYLRGGMGMGEAVCVNLAALAEVEQRPLPNASAELLRLR